MATINAGAAGPINMAALQLSNLNYGNVPIYDASQIRVDNIGRYVDFFGAFTYPAGSSGNGGMTDPYGYDYGSGDSTSYYYPSSGSVNRILEVTPSGVSLEVTNLSIDAPTLFNLAQARDGDGVLNLVFGGNDVFNGSAGNDWIDGFGGNDNVTGGAGNDSVRGLDGADLIDGGAGNDDVNGNQGTDTVRGGDGADVVRGGQGADTIAGEAGDDVHVNGNIGDDQVSGGAGNDAVFGGQDQDRLFGDDGADTLSGDLGSDTLTGGSGADRFVIRAGGGTDVVTDFNLAEGDRIQLTTGQTFTLSSSGGGSVLDLGAGTTITLSGVAPGNTSDWVVFA